MSPVVVALVIPDEVMPLPAEPPAFLPGLPVPAAPLPAGLLDPGDPPPIAPAEGPLPTAPAGAPPPTAALPMPAAPTPPPTVPPLPLPLPPANANPIGSAAISRAEAKLLGLQMIMTRSLMMLDWFPCRSSDLVNRRQYNPHAASRLGWRRPLPCALAVRSRSRSQVARSFAFAR